MLSIERQITNDHICKTQIENLEKQQVEYRLINQMLVVPGHTLFSFNTETGEIKKAEIQKKVSIGFDGQPLYKKEIKIERACYYEQALNRANFIKRLKRHGIYFESK